MSGSPLAWSTLTLRLLVVLSAFGAYNTAASGATIRPQDELLLINSRQLGCTTNDARLANELRASRYTTNGETCSWVDTSWQEVVGANAPGVATVFYVHGNRISPSEARSRGRDVYRRLVRCARDERPIRFIIWSWPASPIQGRLEDYRVKAERTRPVGYQLAWLVEQMPPGMPIGMLGYSYGARVESGAAHLLAGGSLGGLRLASGGESAPRPMEHVYLAPAFDSGWLSPRRFHGRAMQHIDRLLTTVNRRDPAMRFYPLLSQAITERALGFEGPTDLPRSYACRVRKLDATDSVGRSHDLYEYLKTPGLMAKAWRRLTFADSSAPYGDPAPSPTVASNPTIASSQATRPTH